MIGKKTKCVGKLLLQTSVRELHNDIIKSEKLDGLPTVWNNKKRLVSDSALRYLMPRQVKQFTPRYKQMCGCEVCIHCKQLQSTLNSWRKRHATNKNR